jgi:hypothetical protein
MRVLPLVARQASSGALAFDEPAIDLVHLARTTLGDRSLEIEMLEAFGFRATMLMLRMQQAALSSICAAAKALNSSALRVGARRVALAAEAVKLAAESGAEPDLRSSVDELAIVVKETRAAITEFLRTD